MRRRFKVLTVTLLALLALLLAACADTDETAPGAAEDDVPGVTETEQVVPGQEETEEPDVGIDETETPDAADVVTDTATAEATEPAADVEETETPVTTEPMTDTEDTEPLTDTDDTEPITDTDEAETPMAGETETPDDDTITDTAETDTDSALTPGTSVQSSTLADYSIVASDGEELGSIEDFIIDPQNGQIRYALVSVEDDAGLTETTILVPWNQLELQDTQQRAFVLNADRTTLEEAPSFDEFPPTQLDWETEVEEYWENNANFGTNGTNDDNDTNTNDSQ